MESVPEPPPDVLNASSASSQPEGTDILQCKVRTIRAMNSEQLNSNGDCRGHLVLITPDIGVNGQNRIIACFGLPADKVVQKKDPRMVIALEAGPTDIGGSASALFFKLLSLWERDIVSV